MCRPGTSGSAKPQRPLVLVGGGGHCRSVIDAAFSAGRTPVAILDGALAAASDVMGVTVAGDDSLMGGYAAVCAFLITVGAVGRPELRRRLYEEVLRNGGGFATLVASTARVSPWARLGSGTVVLHGACVNAGASIGSNCIINTLACVEHDVRIGSHSHIATGAMVNGGCTLGEEVFIGSKAVVCQGVEIASGAVIGAGAVVTRSIGEPGTYVGVPARRIS